jgi:2-oxoglutarate ferredoxin oxidoreductase subunit beta
VLVHDAHAADPSYAFALSRLDNRDFSHVPIGVFRQVPRDSYDELMAAQIDTARTKQGAGDLAALLTSGDTWQIH